MTQAHHGEDDLELQFTEFKESFEPTDRTEL